MKTEKYLPLGQGLITGLDLGGYAGQSGHTIRITTRGDHTDQRVRLLIRDLLGVPVEEGFATWTFSGWNIRTSTPIAATNGSTAVMIRRTRRFLDFVRNTPPSHC